MPRKGLTSPPFNLRDYIDITVIAIKVVKPFPDCEMIK